MSSPFAAEWGARQATLDDVFGEPFLFSPMAPVINGRRAADPSRSERLVTGQLRGREKTILADFPESDRDVVPFAGAAGELTFPHQQFPSAAVAPRQGDHFTATSRPGTPVYEVISVGWTGIGRLVCRVRTLAVMT